MIKRSLKAQFSSASTISLCVLEGENYYVVEVNYKPKRDKESQAAGKEVTSDGK